MPDGNTAASAALGDEDTSDLFRAPPGRSSVPAYEDGWRSGEGSAEPFLSYVDADPSVNWSNELEQLHEESSRTHFLDRWTRTAILDGIGGVAHAATIADVGCSTGHLLHDLRERYPRARLVGVDLIGSGLEKAHGLVPSAALLRADACDLPLADAAVDAVVSANLLEHVPDDRRALREFARILRPGAKAAIVVPAGPGTYDYYDRFLGHERRYARRELSSKCREAGLEVVHDGYVASLLYPAFWLVKQRNRRRHGDLQGDALERQVAHDIARTHDSRAGALTWDVERALSRLGIRLPFGIRSLVVAARPGATP
ncbi:MAG: methyltransferase domain-containing protein [Solirubrobacteraceae bacterium]